MVQFYDTDQFLINSLNDYVGSGLKAGHTCIVILTAEHLKELEKLLLADGLDLTAAAQSGQYVPVDAIDRRSKFLADEPPDAERFVNALGDVIVDARKNGRHVRVVGEMVALLWAEGRYDQVIRLEQLWDDLGKRLQFSLFCAYPMTSLTGTDSPERSFGDICALHSRIVPAESYSESAEPGDRLNSIVSLQQKAKSLEAEIGRRTIAETSSAHLAAIVESSDDAIISKTLEGRILTWNKAAERIFGYTADEVIGQSIYLLIPPDRVSEEPGILGKLKRGERIDHYETVRLSKSGRSIDVSLTVSPIKDKSGKIVGASKIARDITESKLAQARLREQAEIIEIINRTGQMLSAELNLQNVMQTVTDAATLLTGAKFGSFFYRVADPKGGVSLLHEHSGMIQGAFEDFELPKAADIFGPAFRAGGIVRIDNAATDPRYGKTSPYYGLPAGDFPVVSYMAVPVVSRSGEVLGGLFFGHSSEAEFTERDERIVEGLAAQAAIAMDNASLYELSQREKSKAEAANRAKDEFLATVSHELRTPLSAILGWVHLMRRSALDESIKAQAIDCIERSAKLQSQLIEDILDVSRVITGKLRLNKGPVDMATVVNAAIDSVQLAVESKGVQLQVVMDPLARRVYGDAVRLQQVVWNLLSNAIKFTPNGGQIRVNLERADSSARIIVSDTGIGISSDFLPYVFDRFRQADGSSTRRFGGLGLGLALVRHLIEMHGGTVRVDSPGEDRGSTFTISVPLMTSQERASQNSIEANTAGPNEDRLPTDKALPSLENTQVLLVDDDRDTLEVLTVMLTECGARVQTASTAAEAFEMLRLYRPDVLVSDLAMPGEDGYSLIRRIRSLESEESRQIPAIALTAYARVEDRMQALTSGFDMFVPKPVEPDELVTTIATIIRPRNH